MWGGAREGMHFSQSKNARLLNCYQKIHLTLVNEIEEEFELCVATFVVHFNHVVNLLQMLLLLKKLAVRELFFREWVISLPSYNTGLVVISGEFVY